MALTIYTRDGVAYQDIPFTYEAMMSILKDNTIFRPNDFIEITYPDGDRVAVRKKDVTGIFYTENEDT